MKPEDARQIEVILGKMRCPKGFLCVQCGFETLCKVKIVEGNTYLECNIDDPKSCPFALSFGGSHFCQCPLRVYLAKNLKR